MKIGILGTGPVGKALGNGFVKLGHATMMGSRTAGNAAAAEWAAANGALARAGTFAEATAFGDVLVVCTLGTVLPEVTAAAGVGNFTGKVVIDTTNPLDSSQGFPPALAISGNDSSGETLQRLLPDGRVVKAFNTLNNAIMFRPAFAVQPPMMIAGNDAAAKATVAAILKEFGWPTLDLGGITSARWLEAMCMAWVMVGVATGRWDHAFMAVNASSL
jgi:predicted dinucleotide-binding enzyme